MAIRALSVVLLFSLVANLSGLPTTAPEATSNAHEEHTLSTELRPPPLNEKEQHATVYLINLYAIKNSSSNSSEEMFENDIAESVPDLLEPLATVLLVVEEEDEEKERRSPVNLDEFAEGLEGQGFKVDRINRNGKTKVLKMKLEKAAAQKMVDEALKPDEMKKERKKRSLCLKCGGYGGGYGGYPGGGHYPPRWGGGHYPPRWGGRHYPPRWGGRHYPPRWGGSYCPNCGQEGGHRGGHRGGYPGGGRGCYGGCGGGGGGFSQSSASAHASSSSGGWGRK